MEPDGAAVVCGDDEWAEEGLDGVAREGAVETRTSEMEGYGLMEARIDQLITLVEGGQRVSAMVAWERGELPYQQGPCIQEEQEDFFVMQFGGKYATHSRATWRTKRWR